MNRSEKQMKESIELWTKNPKLLDRYCKALSDEFKKPIDQQRPSHKVALECIQKEKNNEV